MSRRASRWMLGTSALLFLAAAALFLLWLRVPVTPWHAFPPPVARADTGLELRVTLRRDTIGAWDRSPVEVRYAIVNGPSGTHFDNNPERFSFRVEDQQGRLVQPAYWSHRPTGMWGDGQFLFPAGAMLVQVENLRCVRYAPSGPPEATMGTDCMISWDFRRPGTYRVIVKYFGRDDYGDLDSLRALSDSGKLDFPMEPRALGRRLADTATLVVLSR